MARSNDIHAAHQRPRHCMCADGRIYDGEGGCAKCGKSILTRCAATGVLTPECGCRACNREMVAKYAPHLLA